MPAMKQKKGKRGPTPLEQAAELVHLAATPVVDRIPLDNLCDEQLVYQAERLRAWAKGKQVYKWIGEYVVWAGEQLPDEDRKKDEPNTIESLIDAVGLSMEVQELSRLTWPWLFEPEEDIRAPRTEVEARSAGLSVRRPRKVRTPTLTGCQGGFLYGPSHVCNNLRVRGHEMCPACEEEFASR